MAPLFEARGHCSKAFRTLYARSHHSSEPFKNVYRPPLRTCPAAEWTSLNKEVRKKKEISHRRLPKPHEHVIDKFGLMAALIRNLNEIMTPIDVGGTARRETCFSLLTLVD
ncbi:hypothetical protein CDAR_417251 [Caerostris darwini]|uniref:Uncharacterized protein n=1 Tax=Caerostris darwini TaxID=1538125 RepID=A0AAV4X5A1_9ARAC|nr:hypothetical protein CDAR_417251 [Caerostris darwini]